MMLALSWWRLSPQQPTNIGSKTSVWQQPENNAITAPPPIEKNYWVFDFSSTEKMLLRLPRDEHGNIVFNGEAADIIERASIALIPLLTEARLEQLHLVIKKTFPDVNGERLASLVENYIDFLNAKRVLESSAIFSNSEDALIQHHAVVALAKHHLGNDMAKNLLGERNRIRLYLLSRKNIQTNNTLENEQKRIQLEDLETAFIQHITTQRSE